MGGFVLTNILNPSASRGLGAKTSWVDVSIIKFSTADGCSRAAIDGVLAKREKAKSVQRGSIVTDFDLAADARPLSADKHSVRLVCRKARVVPSATVLNLGQETPAS